MRDLSKTLVVIVALGAMAPAAVAQPVAKAAKPAAAPAPKAAPPVTAVEGDERCLVAMALLTQDKQRAQAASLAMVFYAGRLSVRGVDIPTAVEQGKAKLTSAPQVQADLQRCGPAFQATMGSLQKTFAPPPGAQPPAGPAPAAPAPAAPPPK